MAFATIDVTKGITGTIPVTSGGTGLASGTTDQFLKFTGTTTLASAADNAGALVSLGVSDSTTNAANVVFDNVFSDTYSRYIIFIDTIMPATDGASVYFKFRKSDGSGGYEDEARTGYVYHVRHIRDNSTSDYNIGANSGGATTHGTLTGSVKNSTGEHGVKAVINVYRPGTRQSQATMTYLTCDGTYRSHANDDSMSVILSTAANNYHTDAMLGIKFYFSGGNVDDHKIRVYGVTT
mgnify:CR=1 FL=1